MTRPAVGSVAWRVTRRRSLPVFVNKFLSDDRASVNAWIESRKSWSRTELIIPADDLFIMQEEARIERHLRRAMRVAWTPHKRGKVSPDRALTAPARLLPKSGKPF